MSARDADDRAVRALGRHPERVALSLHHEDRKVRRLEIRSRHLVQDLFAGHSESMFKVSDDYTLVGRTVYRRKES